jgi:hypothetical protein
MNVIGIRGTLPDCLAAERQSRGWMRDAQSGRLPSTKTKRRKAVVVSQKMLDSAEYVK